MLARRLLIPIGSKNPRNEERKINVPWIIVKPWMLQCYILLRVIRKVIVDNGNFSFLRFVPCHRFGMKILIPMAFARVNALGKMENKKKKNSRVGRLNFEQNPEECGGVL